MEFPSENERNKNSYRTVNFFAVIKIKGLLPYGVVNKYFKNLLVVDVGGGTNSSDI